MNMIIGIRCGVKVSEVVLKRWTTWSTRTPHTLLWMLTPYSLIPIHLIMCFKMQPCEDI